MKYFGIADAHGIESFIKGDISENENSSKAMLLHIRAGLNRHRHAVVFAVDISEDDAASIEADLADGLYIEALDNLKGSVKELQLTKLVGAEKSWELIPNPDLDPYR